MTNLIPRGAGSFSLIRSNARGSQAMLGKVVERGVQRGRADLVQRIVVGRLPEGKGPHLQGAHPVTGSAGSSGKTDRHGAKGLLLLRLCGTTAAPLAPL